jgi:hypothetical protein
MTVKKRKENMQTEKEPPPFSLFHKLAFLFLFVLSTITQEKKKKIIRKCLFEPHKQPT